jgi:hypothetical protein
MTTNVWIINSLWINTKSRDSAVGIATGYGLDDRDIGVRVQVGSRIFPSPRRSDRLWGPHNFLSNGYWGLFPRGQSGRDVKLTTHLQLVPRSRKVDLYIHSPLRLHGVVLKLLSTGTSLPLPPGLIGTFMRTHSHRNSFIIIQCFMSFEVW